MLKHLDASDPDVKRSEQPRVLKVTLQYFALLGLAPSGVYRARVVTNSAVRSYRTISPLPACNADIGGLLSVALSRSSRTVGVTHHRVLRSPDFPLPYSYRSRNDSDHSTHSGWFDYGRTLPTSLRQVRKAFSTSQYNLKRLKTYHH